MAPLAVSALTVAVLTAIAALRLGELAFSLWRLRADRRAGAAQPVPERGFPWIVAVHAGWFAGCALEASLRPAHPPSAWVAGAALLWAVSLLLRAWLMASLGRLWNVRIVARKAQPIVVRGPYAWVRHPNYLAVILEIAAVPLLLGAVWTALLGSVANGIVLAFRIRREEAYLFSVPGYAQAFGHKKRLLPGVF